MAPPPTLVVVEDDGEHVALMQGAFAQAALPYDLVFLQDGQAVLDYFRSSGAPQHAKPRQASVVLLDLALPLCSGIDVLHALKHQAATQHIPVLIFTGSADQPTIEHCYALGCNAYFTKPLAADQFHAMIVGISGLLSVMAVPTG